MKTSVTPTIVMLAVMSGAAVPGAEPPSPFETEAAPAPQLEIDKLVFAKLKQLGIPPANLCSDAVFVRRVYLDVIGTLPTTEEAKAFLADENPKKRAILIDSLFERKEYVDYWTMKWCDLLRVKGVAPINLWPNAAQAYHRWIRTCVRDNVPYDRFARELLTASGSNFRVPPVNFFRAMQNREPAGIAQAVALTLMGERADKWPKERLSGMAALFSQVSYKATKEWKEQIVFCDRDKADLPAAATLPDGTTVSLPPGEDWRKLFADWLITPKNPCFTRNIANRAWSWLQGRGIVHEPDDIRPDNPPSNPELLALLEKELIAGGYDLKRLFRLILNSQTYQLSPVPRSDKPEAAAHFAYYPMRQLEAEVLIDALNQLSGTTESYSVAVPEPYTYIPEGERAIALGDGMLNSTFLEIFGRSPRGTGMESERGNRPSGAQQMYLLNSRHVRLKIRDIARLQLSGPVAPGSKPSKMAPRMGAPKVLYLAILSRYPTEAELKAVEAHLELIANEAKALAPASASSKSKVEPPPGPMEDLVWALLNSEEFLYRH
jgi:hypothetical protein